MCALLAKTVAATKCLLWFSTHARTHTHTQANLCSSQGGKPRLQASWLHARRFFLHMFRHLLLFVMPAWLCCCRYLCAFCNLRFLQPFCYASPLPALLLSLALLLNSSCLDKNLIDFDYCVQLTQMMKMALLPLAACLVAISCCKLLPA